MKQIAVILDGVLARQAAYLSDDVRAGFAASLDPAEVVRLWNETHEHSTSVAPSEARAWARTNLRTNNTRLEKALLQVYGVGGVLGSDASLQLFAKARMSKAIDAKNISDAMNIDWGNWSAGSRVTSFIASPSGGFARLLARRTSTVQALSQTTFDRVGTALSAGLALGQTSEQIASALSDVIASPSRALMVATTEMNAAMSVASMDNYQVLGVEQVEWLSLDACEICQANSDQGAIPLGQEFDSGDTEPPGHANCRCSILPVVDDGAAVAQDVVESLPAEDADALSPTETVAELPDAATVTAPTEPVASRIIGSNDQAVNQLWSPLVERQTGLKIGVDSKTEIAGKLKASVSQKLADDLVAQGHTAQDIVRASEVRIDMPSAFVSNEGKVGLENIMLNVTPANGEHAAIYSQPASYSTATIFKYNPEATRGVPDWEQSITAEQVQTAFLNQRAEALASGRLPYILEQTWVTGTAEADSALIEVASSKMVQTWAETSNDSNLLSLSMQEVAAKEFGLANTAGWKTDESLTRRVAEKVEKHGEVLTTVLRSQYDATQAFFAEQGITEITLFRGVVGYTPNWGTTATARGVDVQFRPLSSFSTSAQTAQLFGQATPENAIFRVVVPVDRILSMPGTGFGCFGESETVVLGGVVKVDVANAKEFAQYDSGLTPESQAVNDYSKVWTDWVNDAWEEFTR